MQLPETSRIHPVFHVSQLKPVIGDSTVTAALPEAMGEELLIQPEEILETRYNETGHLEVLLKWRNLPDHETSWMKVGELKN